MIDAETEKTAIRARDKLVDAGLIGYVKGKKGCPNRYYLKKINVYDYILPAAGSDKNTVGNTVMDDSENKYTVGNTVENTVGNAVENTVGNTVTNDSHIRQNKDKDKDKENNIPPIPQGDERIPYAEIVDFLNEKAGTSYKASSGKTRTLIGARWSEGFRVDDFKAVIAKKTAQWKGTDMAKYLRPETLFGTKFEGYLNEGGAGDGKAGGDSSPPERLGIYL